MDEMMTTEEKAAYVYSLRVACSVLEASNSEGPVVFTQELAGEYVALLSAAGRLQRLAENAIARDDALASVE
jgi:hypothetical protein